MIMLLLLMFSTVLTSPLFFCTFLILLCVMIVGISMLLRRVDKLMPKGPPYEYNWNRWSCAIGNVPAARFSTWNTDFLGNYSGKCYLKGYPQFGSYIRVPWSGNSSECYNSMMDSLEDYLKDEAKQETYKNAGFDPYAFYQAMGKKLGNSFQLMYTGPFKAKTDYELNTKFGRIKTNFFTTCEYRAWEELLLNNRKVVWDGIVQNFCEQHFDPYENLLKKEYVTLVLLQCWRCMSMKLGEAQTRLKLLDLDASLAFFNTWSKELEKIVDNLLIDFRKKEDGGIDQADFYIRAVLTRFIDGANSQLKRIVSECGDSRKKEEEEEEEVEGEGESDFDDDDFMGDYLVSSSPERKEISITAPTYLNAIDSFSSNCIDFPLFRKSVNLYKEKLANKVFRKMDEGFQERINLSIGLIVSTTMVNILPRIRSKLHCDILRVELLTRLETSICTWNQSLDFPFDWTPFRKRINERIEGILSSYCPSPSSSNDEGHTLNDETRKKLCVTFWEMVKEEVEPLLKGIFIKRERKKLMDLFHRIFKEIGCYPWLDREALEEKKKEELCELLDRGLTIEGAMVSTKIDPAIIEFFRNLQKEINVLMEENKKREVENHFQKLKTGGISLEDADVGGSQLGCVEVKLFYEVKNQLGEGNFGKVVNVSRKLDGKEFAMKIALFDEIPELRRKQVFEILLLKKMKHRYIIGFEDVFFGDKYHYLVMEKGSTDLCGEIEKGRKLEENVIWKYLIQMCIGFNALHKKGLIHQDVKPANILLGREKGDVKICDLGMSMELQEGNNQTQGGTPIYMSPEHISNFLASKEGKVGTKITEKVDCWAVGLIAYELARCGGPKEIIEGSVANPHPRLEVDKLLEGKLGNPISDYSPDLLYVIKKLLDPNVEERWNTMDVLRFEFVRKKSVDLNIQYDDEDVTYDPIICFSSTFHNRFGDPVISLLRECFDEDELGIEFLNEVQPEEVSASDVKSNKSKTVYCLESPVLIKSSMTCLYKRLLALEVLKILHLSRVCKGVFMEGVIEYIEPEIFRNSEIPGLDKSAIFRYTLIKSLFLKTTITAIEFYSFVFGNRNFKIKGGEDKLFYELGKRLFLRGQFVRNLQEDRKLDDELEKLRVDNQCNNDEELGKVILKKRVETTFNNLFLKRVSEEEEEEEEGLIFFWGSKNFIEEMKSHCLQNRVNLVLIKTFPLVADDDNNAESEFSRFQEFPDESKKYDVGASELYKGLLVSDLIWKDEFESGKKLFEEHEWKNAIKKFGNVMYYQPFFLENRRWFLRAVKEYVEKKKRDRSRHAGVSYEALFYILELLKLVKEMDAKVEIEETDNVETIEPENMDNVIVIRGIEVDSEVEKQLDDVQ